MPAVYQIELVLEAPAASSEFCHYTRGTVDLRSILALQESCDTANPGQCECVSSLALPNFSCEPRTLDTQCRGLLPNTHCSLDVVDEFTLRGECVDTWTPDFVCRYSAELWRNP